MVSSARADANALTVSGGQPFVDVRPVSAGLPLSSLGCDGRMSSPLHSPTSPLFQYSRTRQAFGSVSPSAMGPPFRHQPPRDNSEYATEARKSWYNAFSKEREGRAHSANSARGGGRPIGASGGFSSTVQSPGNVTGNWTWQANRGWTSASRHNHEKSMRDVWHEEARQRWRQQMPESEWKIAGIAAAIDCA